MYAKDFIDNHTYCPFDNSAESQGLCLQDRCALWHKSTDPRYSCCGIYSIAHDMSTISYAISRAERD